MAVGLHQLHFADLQQTAFSTVFTWSSDSSGFQKQPASSPDKEVGGARTRRSC